jgi:hypothetical protein
MEKLDVRARNILTSTISKQFWCPGSTLKVTVDSTNPLPAACPGKASRSITQATRSSRACPHPPTNANRVIVF